MGVTGRARSRLLGAGKGSPVMLSSPLLRGHIPCDGGRVVVRVCSTAKELEQVAEFGSLGLESELWGDKNALSVPCGHARNSEIFRKHPS